MPRSASNRKALTVWVVRLPPLVVTWKVARASAGLNGTAMPICWPGLADGAVVISGTPDVACTSLAARMVKW